SQDSVPESPADDRSVAERGALLRWKRINAPGDRFSNRGRNVSGFASRLGQCCHKFFEEQWIATRQVDEAFDLSSCRLGGQQAFGYTRCRTGRQRIQPEDGLRQWGADQRLP